MTAEANAELDGALRLLADAGAGTTVHPSGTLLGHLQGTRALLVRWGCAEHVCAAGLYHSVYGTEAFRRATIGPHERACVRDCIGADAERLAHLYCTMVRRSLYENLDRGAPHHVVDRTSGERIVLDLGELSDLLTLDLANRLEQLPRVPMSLWRMEADRRRYGRAVPFLPEAAAVEMRRVYRRRSRALIAADGLIRLARRLLRRRRMPDEVGVRAPDGPPRIAADHP
ncbi:MAG TPA: hypothetical protein VKA21_01540 [Candidatus Binatia bacterium]|nr:hypothetical protein [Candidatus Binatia bacterium]